MISSQNGNTDSIHSTNTVVNTNNMVTSQHIQVYNPEIMGLKAGNDIPAGRVISLGVTDLVLGYDLLDEKRLQRWPASSQDSCVKVYWRNGRLESSEREVVPPSWLQLLRCARDRHEQNLELVKGEDGLFACTLRQISQGEELLVWYREVLAREAGVPILTLCHIKGYQKYVCMGCHTNYTHPNTLKAHMFLQCSKTLVSASVEERSLIPFHQLLQTLSRSLARSHCGSKHDGKLLHKQRDSNVTVASLSELRPCCSGCGLQGDETTYTSAFRTPLSMRNIKKENGSEEGLMTPDSSTDQSSALNLSVKLTEICHSPEHANRMSTILDHHCDTVATQRIMTQSIAIDYSHLKPCFPVSPPLRTFGIQLLNRDQAVQPHSRHGGAAFGNSFCNREEYSVISTHMKNSQECLGFSLFKSQSVSPSSSSKQTRPHNPYEFSLPSDKEPLDLLPQAYFANKSKKGHLCLCCGKVYSRKYGLKIHMRTHNGYKPLKCKICSRPFGDPSNLNKHVRLHAQGDTPYRCDFCGKVLVRRRDLDRHVRSRHPMDCVQNDDNIDGRESSPDSSPVSVEV